MEDIQLFHEWWHYKKRSKSVSVGPNVVWRLAVGRARSILPSVLLNLSVCPFPKGWYAVVCVFVIPEEAAMSLLSKLG
jgi:hypothetical protein